jgi:hypothetical protein
VQSWWATTAFLEPSSEFNSKSPIMKLYASVPYYTGEDQDKLPLLDTGRVCWSWTMFFKDAAAAAKYADLVCPPRYNQEQHHPFIVKVVELNIPDEEDATADNRDFYVRITWRAGEDDLKFVHRQCFQVFGSKEDMERFANGRHRAPYSGIILKAVWNRDLNEYACWYSYRF